MNGFVQQIGIPFLLVFASAYYGIKLWITKDVTVLRGKNRPPIKDEDGYIREGAGLLLFYAVGGIVMAVLTFFSSLAALIVIAVWTVAFCILWKRMNDRHKGA
jgi:hypothetical protein